MPSMRRSRIILVAAAAFALLLCGAYIIRQHVWPAPLRLAAALEENGAPLPPFALARSGGNLTNDDLRGRWTLMFFGYLNCPDACPTTLAELAQAQARLDREGVGRPQVVFVSVDPQRDTPRLLDAYLEAICPGAIGATGSDAALAALAGFLGVIYQRQAPDAAGHYAVDHTAAVFLIDPQVRLRAGFPPPQQAGDIVADYRTLLRAYGAPANPF